MQTVNSTKRFYILDIIRGFAIFLMFIYHFSYDLDYFNFLQLNFATDPFWLNFRTLIVTLFLIVMGISLYLSSYRELNKQRFLKRLLLLVIYSVVVSISSWVMFPAAMIFFGILHFIALASVLGLLFVRLGRHHSGILNLLTGILLIVAAQFIEHPFFNQPYLRWFGLMTTLPIAVDYVPLLPWFGVVLIGLYIGQLLSQQSPGSFFSSWQSNNFTSKVLALGGRHSLHIYMLHQPLFLGILYIIRQLIG